MPVIRGLSTPTGVMHGKMALLIATVTITNCTDNSLRP